MHRIRPMRFALLLICFVLGGVTPLSLAHIQAQASESAYHLTVPDGTIGQVRCAGGEQAFGSQVPGGFDVYCAGRPPTASATPDPTATVAPSALPSPTGTAAPSPTSAPSATALPTATLPPTPSPTATGSPTSTAPPERALASPVRLGAFLDKFSDPTLSASSAVPQLAWHVGNFGSQQRAFAAALDAAGYAGDHYTYILALEAQDPAQARWTPWPNQFAYRSGDWTYLNSKPDWFIYKRNADGTYSRVNHGDGMHGMDPCSTGYRAWVYQRAKEMRAAGLLADGIALDNVPLTWDLELRAAGASVIYTGIKQPYSNASYVACAVEFVAGLRQALPGLPIWGNVVEGRSTGSDLNPYFEKAGMSGAWYESFATGWPQFGSRWSVNRQNGDLAQAEWLIARGFGLHATSQGLETDLQTQQFALANWLLIVPSGNDGSVTFRYADARNLYQTFPRYPNYELKLGEPLGPRYPIEHGWARDFAGGRVWVNQKTYTGGIEVTK